MSKQYPGGIISKTAPVPSGPYSNSTAPGIWTLEQQAAYAKQGQWPTQGNVNPSAFIENLFQSWLYTGNGGTQTITNGIDLSTQGGMVWIKNRDTGNNHILQHTPGYGFNSNTTTSYQTLSAVPSAWTTTGFTNTYGGGENNSSNEKYVSWTFRKQPKFFDVVTFSGTGSAQSIAHNLGAVPGCIIVKRLNASGFDWIVYHRSIGNNNRLLLNDSVPSGSGTSFWNDTTPTSTVFTVGSNVNVNASGGTYVAYLFAHDAGGFGLTGTDNVISCGSYTGTGSNPNSITLGYEPQWILLKKSSDTANWYIFDNMRGMPVGSADAYLFANSSDAESSTDAISPTATGFDVVATTGAFNQSGQSYIYIAIRRGPMAVPTLGTSVYENTAYTGNGASERKIGSSVLTDLLLLSNTNANADGWSIYAQYIFDRLRGQNLSLQTSLATSETTGWTTYFNLDMNTGWDTGNTTDQGYLNKSISTYVSNVFRRAPSFMDVVCYTGTGSATTQTHNLTVVPEMMIVKRRSSAGSDWWVYNANLGNTKALRFTTESAFTLLNIWNNTTPTSSVFTIGADSAVNGSSSTYVNYLFASLPGVSKVGSYTGTGATQVINCGFTSGARFVLIKRSDSTGDWYVWNSASGIVAGNDPYILLNSAAAEVTGTDYIDTASSGFEISSTAPAAINANGGTFIFLAIA